MESISSSIRKYLKKHWTRRGGYKRLNGSNWPWQRRNKKMEQLGTTTTTTTTTTRRRWRIKVSPKIRISKIPSPKKLLLWLRDAYVRMMMGLANSKVMSMSASATGYGGSATSMAMGGLNKPKEYDENMIIHMYKSLIMAKGQLVPRDAAHKMASQIARPRRHNNG